MDAGRTAAFAKARFRGSQSTSSNACSTYVKAAGFSGRVDRWPEFEFVALSSVLQWTGAADAGTGAYEGNVMAGSGSACSTV